MTTDAKLKPAPSRSGPSPFTTLLAMLITAASLVALGLELDQWNYAATAPLPPPPETTLTRSDEASDLPTVPFAGIPMIKSPQGALVSLRPITVREFQQFADETGLPDASSAWVRYNWGWEWKKGYSWRFPGESHAPGDKVTAISLEDAQAFCRWLTDREHACGTLPQGQFYRVAETDKLALMTAFPGRLQPTVRNPRQNLAPGFHIELAQDLPTGSI